MKLKRISMVTLKEKTLELEHNQGQYTFYILFIKSLSKLSMFPRYIFLFTFDIPFFLRDHNGNKSVQLFRAIPVAIDFLIVFRNSVIYCK